MDAILAELALPPTHPEKRKGGTAVLSPEGFRKKDFSTLRLKTGESDLEENSLESLWVTVRRET